MGRHFSTGRFVILGSLLVIALCAALLVKTAPRPSNSKRGKRPLVLYCAAGIRLPVVAVCKAFEEECGIRIDVQYGGSNTLLSQMQISKKADLYLAADRSYIERAQEMGLVRELLPIACMEPVIAVQQGNPKHITTIDDLLKPGVRLALGNPEQAAIGRATQKTLERAGHWDAIAAQTQQSGVFKPTVPEVANAVKIGSVDAGIIWSVSATQVEGIEGIRVPELGGIVNLISIGVSSTTDAATDALNFARYLTGSNRGLQTFEATGYDVLPGDPWTEKPEITFFAGSVNRRGIEAAIQGFENREGVRVNTIYNGCGILTAQMRTIRSDSEFPDVYMACDQYYLDNVAELFGEGTQISSTKIVIVVAEGNPKSIHSVEDLTRADMRVAVGQPEQCTIGALSRILLEKLGLYEKVMKNVVTETATSAMLVPAVTTGAADAVLAYQTDSLAEADRVDAVIIDSPLAKAVQPFAVAKSSDQKLLGTRLFETIVEARAAFEAAGFDWLLERGQ